MSPAKAVNRRGTESVWLTPAVRCSPPPTPADTKRVKAMTRTVAIDMRRHGTPALGAADKAWLEGQPQSLWSLLFDTAVAISTAGRRDEVLITASRWLLANQLELIRYRLERDHDWARPCSMPTRRS